MVKYLIKLSVWVVLLSQANVVQADSFFLPVNASVCNIISENVKREDIRYQTYDKALYQAVKTSSYMKNAGSDMDDHVYNILAYRLADNALNNVSVKTIRDDNEKICLEITANLDITKADNLIHEQKMQPLNAEKVKEVAQEINDTLPKSIYETDNAIPLLYISDLEFYNQSKTAKYTSKIAQQLSFEPHVLVTEYEELADYWLVPKLLQSKIKKIDEKNSQYNMSVIVELKNKQGNVIDSKQQNRYIIIANTDDQQEIAQKLLIKLIKEAVSALSTRLNSLLRE